ncbi:DUF2163 domain-containing protein [Oceanicella sp. SM1341]|uniref:DUF2163 domain-containing protein n=1 Tax=Oceanicella sp. SM1341 TaxID=1548889 RepID=UPI000E4F0653|nr:DUF2163 domain-containing protein [Oceanicella sp. SM1341]
MRAIDPALRAKLDSGATTLCRCWILVRADGATFGFTDHDRDLEIEGVSCAAASGLSATAVSRSTGLSVDNAQVAGALQSAGITDADVLAGRYDGATISHWLVDWTEPALRLRVFAGSIGEITREGAAFRAEMRGVSEVLNLAAGRSYLRDCDAVLGDARCGVDLDSPAYSGEATVADASDPLEFTIDGLGGFEGGWFARGHVEWLSGANAGTRVRVRQDLVQGTGRRLRLWEQPGAPVAAGDTLRLRAGCDRRAETCRGKFANFRNFRGFPHLPGEDWMTSYVREGDRHDGGSLYR